MGNILALWRHLYLAGESAQLVLRLEPPSRTSCGILATAGELGTGG